jgi:signal transduction histidine kinase
MQPSESGVIRPRASQRRTLLLGFGALLLLMAFVAYRASATLTRIEETNDEIRKEMVRRDDLLDHLRSDLFQSTIEIRDYVLYADATSERLQREEIQIRRERINTTMKQYEQDLETAEAVSFAQLERGLTEYWKALEPIFQWSAEYRRLHGGEFFQTEMIPRRQGLLQMVDQIAAIDGRQMQGAEDSIAAVHRQLHSELMESSALILSIGLLVGFFSVRHVTHLEAVSEKQFQQVVQARSELRHLNARLVAAEEEERRKISRELHDQVGQHLSAVLIELGNVESAMSRSDAPLRRRLDSARRLAEASIAKVRDLALMLRPSMLDDLGLVAALRWHAREISRRTGISAEVAADGVSEDLPNEYRTCIFRVVQEAMNNAVQHAKPARIRVTLRQRAGEIQAVIQDDGAGFDPLQDKGMGMLGMQERVQTLGGVLQIDSEPGTGTTVSVLLPLQQLATVGGKT